jgi:L-lactate dehydrogenase complex protein LldG
MSTPDQEKFLRRIRAALGHPQDRARPAGTIFASGPSAGDLARLERIRRRTPEERRTLMETLAEAARPIKLEVAVLPDLAYATAAIARLAAEKAPEWGDAKSVVAWKHPLIAGLNLPETLGRLGIPVAFTGPIPAGAADDGERRERERRLISAAYIGITSADFCLADTATLVLRNRPGEPRSAAILPSIHVAVLREEQVLADLKELFSLLRWHDGFKAEGLSNYMSFISGPSKTADIEATMVHGAHGPREVHLFVVGG